MSITRLPPKESEKGQEIIKRYLEGDRKLFRTLGYYAHYGLARAMEAIYHIDPPEKPYTNLNLKTENKDQIIVNLPQIELREYKPVKGKLADEEIAILHTSDGHAGKITRSYDEDVYRKRMDTMFDSIMTIITLHRKMYPINDLHIVNTGDNVQGENPFQGSKVGTIRMGARDQTTKLAYPAWVRLIASLKQEFSKIEFDGFGGNHSYDKLAPETSREDFRLYDLLQSYFGNKKGIEINIHEEFAEVININGFRFFCTHFDGIPCQQGIPYFGIDRAIKSWYMQFDGFQYCLGGHFHKRHEDEISSKTSYFMASTLVSDDDWALKKLKISSNPSQNIYGLHKRHGITWRYPLIVDYKFLPEHK